MFAVTVTRFDAQDPVSALEVGERPEPDVPDGWTTVTVKAASLNHHDVWTLRGTGLSAEQLPMVLGCDGAGIDEDGNEVVIHAVIGGPDTGAVVGERPTILTERYNGTFAQRIAVPRANLLPKPPELSFEQAACLPTAWLTAYRMLFTRSGLRPGDSMLVQGAGGGVSTALISLGRAAGFRVWVTSRDEAKRRRALEIGAHEAFPSGARLPERVDAVFESVGEATWEHSVRAVRERGTIVVCGTTSGPNPPAALTRVFFHELRILGSTMGSRDELAALMRFLTLSGVRPLIDEVYPLDQARTAVDHMVRGELTGKLVLTV